MFLTKLIDLLLRKVLIFSVEVVHSYLLNSLFAAQFFCINTKGATVQYRISFTFKVTATMNGQLKERYYTLSLLQVPFADMSSLKFLGSFIFLKILMMHSIWATYHYWLTWILIAWLRWKNLEFCFWNNETKQHASKSSPLTNWKRMTEETIIAQTTSKEMIFILVKLCQIQI